MPGPAGNLPIFTAKRFVKLYETYGSIKAVARATDTNYRGVHASYLLAVSEGLMDPLPSGAKTIEHIAKHAKGKLKAKDPEGPVIDGKLRAKQARPLFLRKRGVNRFFFTCAQNNTHLFDKFWDNLIAYTEAYKIKLHVSRFAYIKQGLGARGDKAEWFKYMETDREDENAKRGKKKMWFDPRIQPFLSDDRVQVAPGLIFCGDENILPTAEKPLSGYEVLTGRASAIFPHVKIEMDSIATVNTQEATKFNYTTGTVTLRNYIQRKAGKKAEFHHCFGGLLVEVDEDGDWFCRQVNANSEGEFYEFDPDGDGCILVKGGKITSGHTIEALNGGDDHAEDEDELVFKATYGDEDSLIDVLQPRYKFHNDLASFNPRSHHNIKDPHRQFLHHSRGTENVRDNFGTVLKYLDRTHRDFCEGIVVGSNHHDHIGRWLKEQDGRRDPVNAEFWHDLGKLTYDYMRKHGEEPNHLQLALRMLDPKMEDKFNVTFLPNGGSFVICHDKGGGIECGLHGHQGPNGARGSATNIARMGRKANIGHSHSACIRNGVYQAGTSSKLKLDYNDGPSSWSQTHIITYKNGKRALVTIWNGKWRA